MPRTTGWSWFRSLALAAALLVFTNHLFFHQFLDVLQGIATDVADCNTRTFRLVTHDANHVLATFFGQRR